ncbi:Tripartite tricarboxylate transporter family receptor [Pigmentiphaga humi]|uniref:Tripartite tricarboxylate transporter family receptor n=1 Tax=Pigmentiphaga humi TaxID=2478468 RepID=A0A3P4AVI5_9BURK|nr:tripartite tricarboxylate transporter substrate binding protein [Pigmentiphaga humi]VCU68039.1 Tripartite tricarboxylate transporter family receptor [Pigmentiphaga humi]
MNLTRRSTLLVAGLFATTMGFAAHAEESYPSRPIRMVVPWPAGGGVDAVARLLSQKLAEVLRVSVIVDNRAGAAGLIGTDQVARSAPDGYTLLMGSLGPNSVNASLYKSIPYDAIKDFTPISLVGIGPYLVAVNTDLPAKNLKELVDVANANPGKFNYGSGGLGSPTHLAAELFKVVTKTDLSHIPYKGSAGVTTALRAGEVQAGFISLLEYLPLRQASNVRALAIASSARNELLPDLPTSAEAGAPGYEFGTWWGVMAPAGVPPQIVTKLNSAVRLALDDAELKQKFVKMGVMANGSTPEEFSSFLKKDIEKWANVIRTAKIDKQ